MAKSHRRTKSVHLLLGYCDFRFFRMATAAILDLLEAYFDDQGRVLYGLYNGAKFCYDQCSIFSVIRNRPMNVLIFGEFG